MMIRFDLFRKKMTSFSMAALFAASVAVSVPQASFANDWVDMLKPLVKDVIVPGASMGMKKLIQREERLHPELAKFNSGSTGSPSFGSTSSNGSGAVNDFFNNTASSSTSSNSTSSANEFASPEEPISSSSVSGSVVGSDFFSGSSSSSANDPAPPPPPPVATP